MKMIMLLAVAALAGWWMWTSLGGNESTAALPGGSPQPTLNAAQQAVDTANAANRKLMEAARDAGKQ